MTTHVEGSARRGATVVEAAVHALSSAQDHATAIERLAQSVVPVFAEGCGVHVLGEKGCFRQIAAAHDDPAKLAIATEMLRQFPIDENSAHPICAAVRQRAPILVEESSDELLASFARGPDHLTYLRRLDIGSFMVIPLLLQGRCLGAMTFAASERYGTADLAVAGDLALHAANAVENARLAGQLAASEATLRSFFDHAAAVMYLKDPEGRILLVNRHHEQLFGRTSAQLVGESVRALFPEQVANEIAAHDRRIVETRTAQQFENEIPHAAEIRHYVTVKFPIIDSAGDVCAIGGISTDVTDRKRSELALRRSEERFSRLFQCSPSAITITDPEEGRFIDVNEAFERISGYDRADLIGRSALELHAWADTEQRRHLLGSLRDHGRVENIQGRLRTKRGDVREILASMALLDFEGVEFVVSLFFDVTEQRRLERLLEQEQRMRAVGELAAGVAHDFNNLMTAIGGFTKLLIEALPTGRERTYAERIKKVAQRAAALCASVLAENRPQPGMPRVVEVNRTITEFGSVLRHLVGEAIVLNLELDPGDCWVELEAIRLEQIVLNLVMNAREAMPEGGTIRISTCRLPAEQGTPLGGVLLTVGDHGRGMDEATLARIFDPYFTTRSDGTGLGMAIVKGLVDGVGGRASVESSPGVGTSVRIMLPLANGTPGEPAGN